jgi:superfamily II DNA or RNA helicase
MTNGINPTVQLQPGAEAVVTAVANQQFLNPQAYRLQLAAAHMLLIGGFDELICLDNLNFEPFPYQIKAAHAALRRFRGRGMLCDEVGLGKTIEAGLIIKEYLLRQMAERILILTPPGLVQQWREELVQKFGLHQFVTNSDEAFRAAGDDAWSKFPQVIASIAAAPGQPEKTAKTTAQISTQAQNQTGSGSKKWSKTAAHGGRAARQHCRRLFTGQT